MSVSKVLDVITISSDHCLKFCIKMYNKHLLKKLSES